MTAASATQGSTVRLGGGGDGSGPRLLVGLLIGGAVAAALYLLMTYLVANSDTGVEKHRDVGAINFIRRPQEPSTPEPERQMPDEPKPPEQPPPPTAQPITQAVKPQVSAPDLDVPSIAGDISIQGSPYLGAKVEPRATLGSGSGNIGFSKQLTPVRRVPPVYPSTAKRAGIEGYVTMVFTVTPEGTVTDIKVVEAKPPHMFNRAAKQALSRWRFRPATTNGEPVAQRARQTIRFVIEDN